MSAELRQVAGGCTYRVASYNAYDVNGYRFHTRSYEESRPNRKTTNTGVFTQGQDGIEYYGIVEEIYELTFEGCKPLNPVIFKCRWFDPNVVRRDPTIGLVEIQQSTVLPGDDVYIVAQQATQVYYLSYPCQSDANLVGWDVVIKIPPHGKLPIPNDADYKVDPNTDDVGFYQEDGLDGHFEIDLTGLLEMDNEILVDEDAGDDVENAKDIELLERLNLDSESEDENAREEGIDLCYSEDENAHQEDVDDDDYF